MPQCRKCTNQFPSSQIIEGKRRSFSSRKFCLECSPFGSRNTKPDDPARETKPRHREQYKNWTEEDRANHRMYLNKRGKELKQKLVDMMGGCCSKCGYKKCLQALDFHHIDPTTKSFSLTSNKLRSNTWETALTEAAKCVILCANCHREAEYGE